MRRGARLSRLLVGLLLTGLLLIGCGGAATPTTESPPESEGEAGSVEQEPVTETPADEAAAGEEGTPYKIGVVVAATGPASGLGMPERTTAEMIAEQLREGIVGPDGVRHAVEVIILDSESNPDTATSAVRRLITEEQVDVLVGGTTSGESLAFVPVATEAEVPTISVASAGAIVRDPESGEVRRWIFKTPQENIHSAEWQADYLEALGIDKVCYLYENTGYGQDTLASAEQAFGESGIEIVYADTFERTDTEFPQMASVQGAGCGAVVVGAIPPGASNVMIALRDFVPDLPVVQGHGVCNAQFIELAPEAVEGTPLPCGRLLVADQLPESDPQRQLLLDYIDAYTTFTGGEPISTFGGHAYDAMQWAVMALESLPEGASLQERRAAIRDYIENNIKEWPGTGGVFTITPEDHLGLDYTALTFVRVENGWYVPFNPDDWK